MSQSKKQHTSSLRDRARCPICAKVATKEAHPFCSSRCQKLDLSRWFSGAYAVPGEDVSPIPNERGDDDI